MQGGSFGAPQTARRLGFETGLTPSPLPSDTPVTGHIIEMEIL